MVKFTRIIIAWFKILNIKYPTINFRITMLSVIPCNNIIYRSEEGLWLNCTSTENWKKYSWFRVMLWLDKLHWYMKQRLLVLCIVNSDNNICLKHTFQSNRLNMKWNKWSQKMYMIQNIYILQQKKMNIILFKSIRV